MTEPINYIKIEETLWLKAGDSVFSFGFNCMEKDMHFSISYSKGLDEFNFHVTKNTNELHNKPKVEIVRIPKKDFLESLPSIGICMLNTILEPIQLRHYKKHNKKYNTKIQFLSFTKLNDSIEQKKFENLLHISFQPSIKRRKKKIEFSKGYQDSIATLANSREIRALTRKKLKYLPFDLPKNNDSGFIISKHYTGVVVRIGCKWYKIKEGINFVSFLKTYFSEELVKTLLFKMNMALERVKRAKTFEEIKNYNKPIYLSLNTSIPNE